MEQKLQNEEVLFSEDIFLGQKVYKLESLRQTAIVRILVSAMASQIRFLLQTQIQNTQKQ